MSGKWSGKKKEESEKRSNALEGAFYSLRAREDSKNTTKEPRNERGCQ